MTRARCCGGGAVDREQLVDMLFDAPAWVVGGSPVEAGAPMSMFWRGLDIV